MLAWFLIALVTVLVLMRWLWIQWGRAGRDIEAFSDVVTPVLVLVLAIVVSPWLAAGLIGTVTSLHSFLIEHGEVDWSGTGAMLTALVAVPGTIAAVYFGIIQYRREMAKRSPETDTATAAVKEMLPPEPDASGIEEIRPPQP